VRAGASERRGPDRPPAALAAAEQRLLEAAQRDLALVPRPFARLARRLGGDEAEVLATLASLRERGVIDRVGPVLEPRACGASTLAALAVPEAHLEEVAAAVNRHPEVNHNYAREHRFNLWFVLTAASAGRVARALAAIEARTGCTPLDLPMTRAFHVDLGFCAGRDPGAAPRPPSKPAPLAPAARRVVLACQDGLELIPRPYARLAERLGLPERTVLETLAAALAGGAIKRIGAVVHHRALGLRANAMVVWAVPDRELDRVGRRLARSPAVSLCYARRPSAPRWPYNLYCMIHARERREARARLAAASARAGLERYPREILFSTRCFRQRGARYLSRTAADG